MAHLTRSAFTRPRYSRLGIAVVTGSLLSLSIAVPKASAEVLWTVDAAGTSLVMRATAGDTVDPTCNANDRVRTRAGLITTVPCSTLKSLRIEGSPVNDYITMIFMQRALFPTLTSVTVVGQAGDDRIIGGDFDELLAGGTGNDRVIGGPGNDIVQGNSGDDKISGGLGADSVLGGDGADTVTGHRDDLATAPYDDTRDQLSGGRGSDRVNAVDTDIETEPSTDDPASADVVKWVFRPTAAAPTATAVNLHTGDQINVGIDTPEKWSIGSSTTCGCLQLRRKLNPIKGDFAGPVQFLMSPGDDTMTLNMDLNGVPLSHPVSVVGNFGTDELRIFIQGDPTEVVNDGLSITYRGTTVRHAGFENIKIVRVTPPA
jgi:Ca2+-binding RTX toxin-like protein